jgi:hypothetical protein
MNCCRSSLLRCNSSVRSSTSFSNCAVSARYFVSLSLIFSRFFLLMDINYGPSDAFEIACRIEAWTTAVNDSTVCLVSMPQPVRCNKLCLIRIRCNKRFLCSGAIVWMSFKPTKPECLFFGLPSNIVLMLVKVSVVASLVGDPDDGWHGLFF